MSSPSPIILTTTLSIQTTTMRAVFHCLFWIWKLNWIIDFIRYRYDGNTKSSRISRHHVYGTYTHTFHDRWVELGGQDKTRTVQQYIHNRYQIFVNCWAVRFILCRAASYVCTVGNKRNLLPARWSICMDSMVVVGAPKTVTDFLLTPSKYSIYGRITDYTAISMLEKSSIMVKWQCYIALVGTANHISLPYHPYWMAKSLQDLSI